MRYCLLEKNGQIWLKIIDAKGFYQFIIWGLVQCFFMPYVGLKI